MVEKCNNYWISKSRYLNKVTGYKIIEVQEEINSDNDSFVIATQIFPVHYEAGLQYYDVFIYYKVNPDKDKIVEEEIVITPEQAKKIETRNILNSLE